MTDSSSSSSRDEPDDVDGEALRWPHPLPDHPHIPDYRLHTIPPLVEFALAVFEDIGPGGYNR